MTCRRSLLVVAAVCSAACGGPTGAGEGAAALTPVASVGDVMDAIVIPSSQALFDSVVYVNGELTQAPKTDDDWFRLRMHAMAVAEAGNLLLMPPRSNGEAAWVESARALTTAAARAAEAADVKNVDLMLQTGSEIYDACTSCHEQYLMEQP